MAGALQLSNNSPTVARYTSSASVIVTGPPTGRSSQVAAESARAYGCLQQRNLSGTTGFTPSRYWASGWVLSGGSPRTPKLRTAQLNPPTMRWCRPSTTQSRRTRADGHSTLRAGSVGDVDADLLRLPPRYRTIGPKDDVMSWKMLTAVANSSGAPRRKSPASSQTMTIKGFSSASIPPKRESDSSSQTLDPTTGGSSGKDSRTRSEDRLDATDVMPVAPEATSRTGPNALQVS